MLTNPHDSDVCFKVKTTAPRRYCVRPNAARIPPRQTVKVEVLVQAMEQYPAEDKCKDKSDYCLACKDRAFDDCFACCDRSAWNCECKPGALSAGSIAACSAESAQCAIGALDGLPARSP